MKDSKKKRKRLSRKSLKQGARGAISILLCLLLSPFVTVTLALVEYARYQQVVELCDEVYELTGISVLSDYDTYLHQRFGLLATSQTNDLSTTGLSLLEENVKMLGNQVTLDGASVEGALSLSNVDILKQQVVDFSELTASAAVLEKDLNLDELLDKLSGLTEISGFLDTVDSLADLTEAVRKAAEKLQNLEAVVQDAYDSANAITSTATTLAADMAALYQKLSEQGVALPEDASQEAINAAIDSFQRDYQEDYRSILEQGKALYNQLKELPNKLDKIKTAADEFVAAVQEAKTAAEGVVDSNDQDPDGTITKAATQTLEEVLDEMESLIDSTIAEITDDAIQKGKEAVNDIIDTALETAGLKDVVDRYQQILDGTYFSSPMGETAKQDLIAFLKSVYTVCQTQSGDALIEYFKDILIPDLTDLNLTDIWREVTNVADSAARALITEETKKVGEMINNLIDMVTSLFGVDIKVFYDDKLNAQIPSGDGDGGGYQDFLDAWSELKSAAQGFASALTSGIFALIKALIELTKMLVAIGKLLGAVITIVGEALGSIGEFVGDFFDGDTRGVYERLLISGYMRHNLPCRLDADYILDGEEGAPTGLTGYSFGDIPSVETAGQSFTPPGGFEDLAQVINNTKSGSSTDPMFKGAHMEYILGGTNSEIANQNIAFFNMYFLRLMLNLVTVMKDNEVRALATSATIASWVVYIIYILAEPFCDMLLLVNNLSVPLVKSRCWLVPTQLTKYLTRLGEATLGSELEDQLKSFVNGTDFGPNTSGAGESEEDARETDYRTHMLILMMIFVGPDVQIKRLSDLIEMETKVYYDQQGESFQMSKAYTAVTVSGKAELGAILDLGKASGAGTFLPSVELKQMISY